MKLRVNMKRLICGIVFILTGFLTQAQNGLENIIVEKYYVSSAKDTAFSAIGGKLPIGSTTYRIYVDMLPGYKFQAAFGIPDHELRLATTTKFFNNEDKGATIPNVIPDHNLPNNTVMLDSWISTGAGSESNLGILKSEDDGIGTIVNSNGILQNDNPIAGIALKNQDGFVAGEVPKVTAFAIDSAIKVFGNSNDNSNSIFSTLNGSWACMNGSTGPTSENKVLIAQVTTDGSFSFELNIQIGKNGGGIEQYVAKSPKGKEIQLATLTYPLTDLAPQIKLVSPLKNKSFASGTTIPIKATANDKDGSVSIVEFYVNKIKVGEDNSAPYQFDWTATGTKATIEAVAKDNLGLRTISVPIKVTIANKN